MYLTLHPDNMFQKMNSIRTVSKKTQGKKEKEKKEKREGEKDDSQVKECLLISNNILEKTTVWFYMAILTHSTPCSSTDHRNTQLQL